MGFWVKSRPQNRRLNRRELLEVKLRSGRARAERTRLVAVSLGVCFVTIVLLFLAWRGVDWALARLIRENPAFEVRAVDLQTDGILDVDQLRRWAGISPGRNLFALDLASIKRNLELSPLVQSAQVERILPDTVRIRVTERQPVAQTRVVQGHGARGGYAPVSYLFDAAGFVMMPLKGLEPAPATTQWLEHLPLLVGVVPSDLRPGRRAESAPVHAALRFLRAFEASPMAGVVGIAQIDLGTPEVLEITTSQGSKVTFAMTHFELQLRRWRAVHEYGRQHHRAIATVDLSVADNIPALWIDASAVPPLHPRPAKPSRLKKKDA